MYDKEKMSIDEKTIEEVNGVFEIIFDNIENIDNVANYSINIEK